MTKLTFMIEEPKWDLSSLNLKMLALELGLQLDFERVQDSRFPQESIIGTVIGTDENIPAFKDALDGARGYNA